MSRSPGVRVEGARELRRALKKAGVEVKELRSVNLAAAEIAARASSSLAPVRSGALAATIRAGGTQTAGILRAGKAQVKYAGPIHWGWAKRGIKPQPFLATGARDSQGQWLPVYETKLEGIVKKITQESKR